MTQQKTTINDVALTTSPQRLASRLLPFRWCFQGAQVNEAIKQTGYMRKRTAAVRWARARLAHQTALLGFSDERQANLSGSAADLYPQPSAYAAEVQRA